MIVSEKVGREIRLHLRQLSENQTSSDEAAIGQARLSAARKMPYPASAGIRAFQQHRCRDLPPQLERRSRPRHSDSPIDGCEGCDQRRICALACMLLGMASRGNGILRNELYVGRVIWNRSEWIKRPGTSTRIYCPRPRDEWIINEREVTNAMHAPDTSDKYGAELVAVDTEIARVVDAIATIGVSAALQVKLTELEQRKAQVEGELSVSRRAKYGNGGVLCAVLTVPIRVRLK